MVIEGKQSLDFEDRSDLYNDSGNKSVGSGASRCGYAVSRELTGQAAYRQQKSKTANKQTRTSFIELSEHGYKGSE